MSRPRVQRRSDGIPEIVPHRREESPRSLRSVIAAALVGLAGLAGSLWRPALLAVALLALALAATAAVLIARLAMRRRRAGSALGDTGAPSSTPAEVRPIRSAPGASTRGA